MNSRRMLVDELKKYFSIKELVCNHVYEKYGERAWMLFDVMALRLLLILRRDILKVPMVCNTATMKQRGLRCNMCEIVKEKTSAYVSAHVTGKGFDFSSPAMSAEEMRLKISECVDMLPCKVRIEQGVNWLHIDVYDEMTKERIRYFRV